jgi:hypothetical protein
VKREAYLVVYRPTSIDYTPVWDMDPIHISLISDGFADPCDPDMIKLVETIREGEGLDDQAQYVLVWCDTGHPVQVTCPVCGDIFRASDGVTDEIQSPLVDVTTPYLVWAVLCCTHPVED